MKLSFPPVKKLLLTLPVIIVVSFIYFFQNDDSNSLLNQNNEEIAITPKVDPSIDAKGDTFSIVAYDKTTGQVGGAGCSCVPGISGGIVFLSDLITDGTNNPDNIVGAIHSQAAYNASTQTIARNRMLAGDTPQEIIDATVAADGGSASRQYGVVGVDSPGAAGFTGSSNSSYANDIQYDDANFTISIQGNILDTSANGGQDDILEDMQEAFLNAEGTLADRLMAALQGAKRVGGDNRCYSTNNNDNRGSSGTTAFVQVLSPGETSPSISYNTGNAVSALVEPIDVLQCLYDNGESTPFCRQTINTFPYTMDFETKSWEQETATCSTNSSWIRSRHASPSGSTGPSAANQGDLYIYIEASDVGGQGTGVRNAILGSPCFEIATDQNLVLEFDYHMFGADMGTLSIEANTGSGWASIWSETGDQGDVWNTAEVNLSSFAGETVKLRIDGTTGAGFASDMAVDNIRIYELTPVTCTNTVNEFPYNESFEGNIGLWTQASGDDGNWLINSDTTPSTTTGPSAANDGTDYLYIEASSTLR